THQLAMARATLLLGLGFLGIASAHLLNPRIPQNLQAKNYPGQCSAAEQTATKTCLDAYFLMYGIDSSKGLPDYMDYVKKTTSIIELYGVDGFDFYCDFEVTLESCLGNLMSSACMNPDGFTKMYGLDKSEASSYATTFPVAAYTCQNLDLTKTYYPCMMEINKDHMQGLIDCTIALEKEFRNATDICTPYDHDVTCIENYYVKYCGEGIRSYICNTEEIAINFDLTGCEDKLHQC
ncbi:hypothetical protein PMAYCL1PPCAC_05708, partial [Pristionchus mayeri]